MSDLTEHRLVPDHNGEPSCLCGWTPTPPEFTTRMAAISGVHRHVAQEDSAPRTARAMTMPDFLLARIAEDEAAARAAMSDQEDEGWSAGGPSGITPVFTNSIVLTPHVGIIHEAVQIEHVVRWDPWRAVAECEAKRRIVLRLALMAEERKVAPDLAEYVLGELALLYATHPGFDPEWFF